MARDLYIIVAGGTGGHIIPGINIGQAIERLPGGPSDVQYISGTRDVERIVYTSHDLTPKKFLSSTNPKRLKVLQKAARLGVDTLNATQMFLLRRPRAILAMGGAVCVPVLSAATLLRIPYFLHDSNAIPGRVTRFFGKGARKVFLGFPCDLPGETQVVGTPTRPSKGADLDCRKTILCMGGSQGASALNAVYIEAANRLDDDSYQLMLISGPGKKVDDPGRVEVHEYREDIPELLAKSRIVVSRSGAGTLCELAAAATPAILVPYPFAKDDHQSVNASFFAKNGAAMVLPEDSLTADELKLKMERLLIDEEWESRSRAMANLACPEAADVIVKEMFQITAPSPVGKSVAPVGESQR